MKRYLPKIIGSVLNLTSYISAEYAANMALHIFSIPRKGKPSKSQMAFLKTASRRDLEFNGMAIATYHWKGEGPSILLAHGWESNSARWKRKIQSFRKEGFNIYALDAPAHGFSGSQKFNAILYSECIQQAMHAFSPSILIGHSVGGMACVFAQQKYKNPFVEHIVLLGTPSEFKRILNQYVQMLGYNARVQNSMDTVILNKYGAHPDHFSTSKFIKDIDASALIIHDKEDVIIPFSEAEDIVANTASGTLVKTEGLGHSLNDQSVSRHIIDYLNKTS